MSKKSFGNHSVITSDNHNFLHACASWPRHQLEAVDSYGNTALLKACYLGDLDAVQLLMSLNVNLHAINYFGQNALTLAAYSGSIDIVFELLKHRSYTDFTLSSMVPPICVAVLRGHEHLVAFFKNMHPMSFRSVHGLTVVDLHNMKQKRLNQYVE